MEGRPPGLEAGAGPVVPAQLLCLWLCLASWAFFCPAGSPCHPSTQQAPSKPSATKR